MTADILTAARVKAGLYTSPHLVSYTERFVMNGKPITESDFAGLVDYVRPFIATVNKTGGTGDVTQFEALTAMAMAWFSKMKAEAVVVEVGMGGRWDATNVVHADVAVITNIALEHTERLGNTIEAITGEKAGIIKSGSKVITGADQPEALRIIQEQSVMAGVRPLIDGRDFEVIEDGCAGGKRLISVRTRKDTYKDVLLPLRGQHQALNAALAISAAEALLDILGQDKRAIDRAVRAGLAKATSPGRLETISEKPLVVLDGAHNPAGAQRLAAALKNEYEYDRLILVLGVLADKDVEGIVGAIAPAADAVITAAPAYYRAMPAVELAAKVAARCGNVTHADSVAAALAEAKRQAGPKDMILVTGSLYTVGEVKLIS
jgi:dihydrofolate synthase/folylpolyglutamate synthase